VLYMEYAGYGGGTTGQKHQFVDWNWTSYSTCLQHPLFEIQETLLFVPNTGVYWSYY